MVQKETFQIKVTLKGKDVDKFEAVREKLGVLHNSEVIRICINSTYEDMLKQEVPA